MDTKAGHCFLDSSPSFLHRYQCPWWEVLTDIYSLPTGLTLPYKPKIQSCLPSPISLCPYLSVPWALTSPSMSPGSCDEPRSYMWQEIIQGWKESLSADPPLSSLSSDPVQAGFWTRDLGSSPSSGIRLWALLSLFLGLHSLSIQQA